MVIDITKKNNSNRILYSFFATMIAVLLLGFSILWRTYVVTSEQDDLVNINNQIISEIHLMQLSVSQAESSVRAFLLTRQDTYLINYQNSQENVWKHFETIDELVPSSSEQYEEITELKILFEEKFKNSDRLLKIAENSSPGVAESSSFFEKSGRQLIRISTLINKFENTQKERLLVREEKRNLYNAIFNGVLIFLAFASLAAIAICVYLFRKTELFAKREKEELKIRSHVSSLALTMTDDLQVQEAGHVVLSYLTSHFSILASKIFLVKNKQAQLVAYSGTKLEDKEDFKLDQSLLNQVIETGKVTLINSVPENYWKISSSLGDVVPKNLLILPFSFQGKTLGVIEMARFRPYDELELKAMDVLSEAIGVGLGAAYSRTQVQELLEETQQQAQELQAQQEELQSSNEELEQQTRELEAQQEALALKNRDLEEVHRRLKEKAEEIKKASQYKSEFLANMSHELRTPLNSLLILSSILAENKEKNLTSKQVDFATSIHNSGNDLLLLIDDILDLAKVEANKMKLNIKPTDIEGLVLDVEKIFKPQMDKKDIRWINDFDPKLKHKEFYTDSQRVGQIIRNFISNAIKFTAEGSVTLKSELIDEENVRFSVIDTGVGIPVEKQKLIFEAFEQLDASISRKYGGTGLGLNIAQKFSQLLNGKIELKSTEGEGSTFSVTFPLLFHQSDKKEQGDYYIAKETSYEKSKKEIKEVETKSRSSINNQADLAVKGIDSFENTILVVEDDEEFRHSICEVVRTHGFRPIEACDGEVAMRILEEYLPSAVLLDIKIPGISGMGVLESIKKRSDLRHIPVHMISGVDYQQSALRMGALGYLSKPVSIEKIHSAMERIKSILSSSTRKVLLVEDDKAQQIAIKELITDKDVEVLTVSSGEDALSILEKDVIDCVILDLNLPDITGLELLKRLKSLHKSFPPVIIYTAKTLGPEEEAKLRLYSESIVIKSVRSVERLLNEVNLFIHRMESLMPEEKREMVEKVRSSEFQFENRKILLVDDDLRNVFALTNALESKGFIVDIARNGKEALDTLSKNPYYDIILMDIMMPEMDGYEAIRRIRRSDATIKHIPIIALTAKAMKEDHENCIAAGANDYLAKPINLTNLMTVLKVWLPVEDFLQ